MMADFCYGLYSSRELAQVTCPECTLVEGAVDGLDSS